MLPNILYIHGAGATSVSFSWLRDKLPEHNYFYAEYSLEDSVENTANKLELEYYHIPNLNIVGHSLGGLIATKMALNLSNIKSLTTIATPFSGTAIASLLNLWSPGAQLFKDLNPYGSTVRNIRRKYKENPPTNHTAFVTTSGLPLMHEPNDGVVSVASQMALDGPDYFEVRLNHFEVLMSEELLSGMIRIVK